MSSRSRGSRRGERGADGRSALGVLVLGVRERRRRVRGVVEQRGAALAAPELVERRVAGDREQPLARRPLAGVEARALAIGALERDAR